MHLHNQLRLQIVYHLQCSWTGDRYTFPFVILWSRSCVMKIYIYRQLCSLKLLPRPGSVQSCFLPSPALLPCSCCSLCICSLCPCSFFRPCFTSAIDAEEPTSRRRHHCNAYMPSTTLGCMCLWLIRTTCDNCNNSGRMQSGQLEPDRRPCSVYQNTQHSYSDGSQNDT